MILEFWNSLFEAMKDFIQGKGGEWRERERIRLLDEPPSPEYGDIALNVPFRLSKEIKESPEEISKELEEFLTKKGFEIRRFGPYINVLIPKSTLISALKEVLENDVPLPDLGKGRKAIVEHTSINPIKPLHVGHARNAILGDVMARILRACNFNVEVHNLINDLGRQIAVFVWGYRKFGCKLEEAEKSGEKLDFWMGKLYAKFAQALKANPEWEDEVDEVMRRIEPSGDLSSLKDLLTEACLRSNLETCWRLKIYYDLLAWDRDIEQAGIFKEGIELLKKKGAIYLAKEGEKKGCWLLRASDYGLEDKVLIRSNGVPTYTAKDIAYQMWKFGLLSSDMMYVPFAEQPNGTKVWSTKHPGQKNGFGNADIVINVIGAEQEYPQKIVKLALKLAGFEKESKNYHHLSYAWVVLREGRFSGRKGNWVGYHADAVLDYLQEVAYEEVSKRNPGESEEWKNEVAEKIAVGALRFALLKPDLAKQIVFEWEKILEFEGDTGPYLQYSYARALRILEKVKDDVGNFELLNDELFLVKRCFWLPIVLERVVRDMKPNLLANYALELAKDFSKFYEQFPVIKAEEELKKARLGLVKFYLKVSKKLLELLGLEALERM